MSLANEIKAEFIERLNKTIENLEDNLVEASVTANTTKLAKLFQEILEAERLLECLETHSAPKNMVEGIVYPLEASPYLLHLKSKAQIEKVLGGDIELAHFGDLSVLINGDFKDLPPNPYLPAYRGVVVVASHGWENLD